VNAKLKLTAEGFPRKSTDRWTVNVWPAVQLGVQIEYEWSASLGVTFVYLPMSLTPDVLPTPSQSRFE